MKFEHYILTRFNLPYDVAKMFRKVKDSNRCPWNDPEWLEMRCNIFEKVAMPSYRHQTNQNFTNLLLASTHTVEPYKSRIESWGLPVAWMPGDDYPFEKMRPVMFEIMQKRLKAETTYLISSLADSDDALHEDYVKLVQEQIRPDKENITPRFGVYYSVKTEERRFFTNTLRIRNMPNTIEPVDSNLITAIGLSHSKLSQRPPDKLQLPPDLCGGFSHRWMEGEDPLFIKMVHCGNIMNKMKTATRFTEGQNSSLEKFHMEEL